MNRHLSLVLVLSLAVASTALALPYNAPTLDGHVTTDPGDWTPDEWIVDDPSDDNRWFPDYDDADLDDLYVTWDDYALYVGITTLRGPSAPFGNGYLLFIDTDAQGGITGATDFTYADFYPRRITFSTMGVDVVMGAWSLLVGSTPIRHCADPTNTTPVEGSIQAIDPDWKHIEIMIPWHGLYGLGDGHVPPGTTLRFIAAIVGGDESGAYDAMPSTTTGIESDPATPWNAHTDLDVYYETTVDANGDGVPDDNPSPVEKLSWGCLKEFFLP